MAFTPRLSQYSPTPIQDNPWWYSNANTYYSYGAGMPNCTCYCFGRTAEINNAFNYDLPQYNNGGEWYDVVEANGIIPCGYAPKLGGIMVFKPIGAGYGYGHVAQVEEIDPNTGIVTTSNSGYQSTYFWTEQLNPQNNYITNWMISGGRYYYYQGCIYVYEEPTPPTPTYRKDKMPVWMMLRSYAKY